MIVKERDFPERLFKMSALNRRLPAHHKRKASITTQVGNLRAGYIGEASIDYYLQFLPQDYRILHNLRLTDMYGNFQMDTLILTSRFILIIEVKNVAGTISFDDMGQVIRHQNETEDSFSNPVAQVNLQHVRLRNWLAKHHFRAIPIKKLIVYANPNSIIKNLTETDHLVNTVIRKELLPIKVEEIEKTHAVTIMSDPQLEDLSQLLIKSHNPEKINVLKRFNILERELLKGVFCPECGTLPMKRVHSKWRCLNCDHYSRVAHIPALQDYYFLFGEEIKNEAARDFLRIESPYVTQHLLKSMGFEKIGINKGRKYILKFPEFQSNMEIRSYVFI